MINDWSLFNLNFSVSANGFVITCLLAVSNIPPKIIRYIFKQKSQVWFVYAVELILRLENHY